MEARTFSLSRHKCFVLNMRHETGPGRGGGSLKNRFWDISYYPYCVMYSMFSGLLTYLYSCVHYVFKDLSSLRKQNLISSGRKGCINK